MYTVYKHTCPNGKVYIGITCMNVADRWKCGGKGYRKQYFYRAVQKYGWDNIEHSVIAENLTKSEAEDMEVKLIATHHSNNPQFGYNIDNGGKVGDRMSETTKEKLRQINIGKRHTENAKLKMSLSQRGRTHTEETKAKISQSHRGFRQSEETKAKISAARIGMEVSAETREKISKAVKGENNPNAKKILLVDEQGNVIKMFSSSQQAQIELHISKNSITAVLKGRQKQSKGYMFKYAEITP